MFRAAPHGAYAETCPTCGAAFGFPCRDLTRAPLVIKKSAVKMKRERAAATPTLAKPHDARVKKAAAR